MTSIRPFPALRPPRDLASRVAAPPYDVVNREEARALAAGNPDSFLHVSRPDIDLDDSAAAEALHRQGRAALEDLIARGSLVRDDAPVLLVYRQRMGDAVQTGIVGCASAEEYRRGLIAIHEHTRPDKENDRTEHIAGLGAHDEPVFLMYRPDVPGAAAIADVVARTTAGEPEYDFATDDGVAHTLWVVDGEADIRALSGAFGDIPTLYVADGHHRSAAAARVWDDRPSPETDAFPVVVFPADDLTVMAYNRAVRDLNGHALPGLLDALAASFDIEPAASAPTPGPHQFGLYAEGQWRLMAARDAIVDESDPIARLDVSILQDRVLAPLLGIDDPRTDRRIAFVGGIRGTAELERLVDSGDFAIAFALHPTSPGEVMDVADRGEIMPPKSTWFEPKLRSGLFVHAIDV